VDNLRADFVIGFLGGGQLARMSAYQALRYGIRTAVYGSSSDPEPMEWVTPLVHKGSFDNYQKMLAFFKACDVVTLENEFLDSALLKRLVADSGTPMYPQPEAFAKIEDKITEKRTFEACGVPVAPWMALTSVEDARLFAQKHGYPFLIKSSKGGYDGYGNRTIKTEQDITDAWAFFGGDVGRELLAEAFVPFEKELAVSVVRSKLGTVVYPCVETIQKNHICKEVIAPAGIDGSLRAEAERLARAVVEHINGIGIFAFEFFLTRDGRILMNESAPRPHNSAHYSIEACVTSQFENHVRSVMGWMPGPTAMRRPVAVMINLLGTHNRQAKAENAAEAMAEPDGHLHLYGKLMSKTGRKMGHYTLLGDDPETTFKRAKALTENLHI
jgi:5-(carboxyamino)imidazole ribonucleotide synthase